jgi:hypothetical protein
VRDDFRRVSNPLVDLVGRVQVRYEEGRVEYEPGLQGVL